MLPIPKFTPRTLDSLESFIYKQQREISAVDHLKSNLPLTKEGAVRYPVWYGWFGLLGFFILSVPSANKIF